MASISAAALALVALGGNSLSPPLGASLAFVSGKDGYHTYRIPSVVRIPGGKLMMFAEGRKLSSSDHGWNDVVAKTSADNGATWGELDIVYSESTKTKNVCIGNPSPVVLAGADAGKVVLVACRNNQEVIVFTGTPGTGTAHDSAYTWSKPTDVTAQAVRSNWSWVATGPPQGLLLESGRILIASDHMAGAQKEWGSHAMLSDDNGKSWALSNDMEGGNECQAAITPNGSLVMNQRTRTGERQFSWSHDDGATWSAPTTKPFAFSGKYGGGGCEGSSIAVGDSGLLLFSTPFAQGRANMSVFGSRTGGASWELVQNVDPGPSAYSALVDLNATHYGLAWETENYGSITFAALPLPASE